MNQAAGGGTAFYRINLLGIIKEITSPQVIGAIIEDSLDLAERQAKSLAPVDKGELRDSIGHEVKGVTGRLFAKAEHAEPVEFGHVTRSGSSVAPRPFLRQGAEDGFDYMVKRIERHVEQTIRKSASSNK